MDGSVTRVRRRLALLATVLFAFSFLGADCTDDETDGLTGPVVPAPDSGRYVALGNSVTAGFINGGLVQGGQAAGFPSVIAAQAGWAPLSHPLVDEPGIGSTVIDGVPQSALFLSPQGAITSVPVNPLALLLNALQPVPYDNLGVPGATSTDLVEATNAQTSQSGSNSFFDLILRNSALPPGTWSAIDQLVARNPSVITVWTAFNDVLGGALGGNPVVGVNISPPALVEAMLGRLADAIDDRTQASYVAIGNLGNITEIPFVTTVPIGVNVEGVGLVRWQTEETDVQFVLLRAPVSDPAVAPTYLPPPFGSGANTLGSEHTLTADEVMVIESTMAAYNTAIAALATGRGWALADIASELHALPRDPTNPANFAVINAIFPVLPAPIGINGNAAFSLDGAHPSEKGQALTANVFIRAFNDTYDLAIDEVDVDGVSNLVGFPGGAPRPTQSRPPLFDDAGRRALDDLVRMMGAGVEVR